MIMFVSFTIVSSECSAFNTPLQDTAFPQPVLSVSLAPCDVRTRRYPPANALISYLLGSLSALASLISTLPRRFIEFISYFTHNTTYQRPSIVVGRM